MSRRPLDITQRQMRAIIEAAKKAGLAPVVTVGNTTIRLVPEDRVIQSEPPAAVDAKRIIPL